MNLSKERRKELTDIYSDWAEEIRIIYTALRCEGFDAGEAMQIIVAMIRQPAKIDNYKQYRDYEKRLDKFKSFLKEKEE